MKRYPFPRHDERNTRICLGCGQEKSIALFRWEKRCWAPRGRCFECDKIYNREWYRRNRARPRADLWTPERVVELARHIAADDTAIETAAATGRTVGAVEIKRWKEGLPPFKTPAVLRCGATRVQPQAAIDRIAELLAAGCTYSQIAARTGFSRSKVAGIIRDHLKPRRTESRHEITLPDLRAPGCPAGIDRIPQHA